MASHRDLLRERRSVRPQAAPSPAQPSPLLMARHTAAPCPLPFRSALSCAVTPLVEAGIFRPDPGLRPWSVGANEKTHRRGGGMRVLSQVSGLEDRCRRRLRWRQPRLSASQPPRATRRAAASGLLQLLALAADGAEPGEADARSQRAGSCGGGGGRRGWAVG